VGYEVITSVERRWLRFAPPPSNRPDVLILDLGPADISGIGAWRSAALAECPVIVFSYEPIVGQGDPGKKPAPTTMGRNVWYGELLPGSARGAPNNTSRRPKRTTRLETASFTRLSGAKKVTKKRQRGAPHPSRMGCSVLVRNRASCRAASNSSKKFGEKPHIPETHYLTCAVSRAAARKLEDDPPHPPFVDRSIRLGYITASGVSDGHNLARVAPTAFPSTASPAVASQCMYRTANPATVWCRLSIIRLMITPAVWLKRGL